jgi:c-di-GMP-related signal transduction protein
MFSLLPAMLRIPMSDLAPALPLGEKIREALLGAATVESCLLRWVESHERGDWLKSDAIEQSHGLHVDELMQCYGESVVWAEAALQVAG